MKKLLFATALIAGTTLGFAKGTKQEKNTPVAQTVNNNTEKNVITKTSIVGHLMHVEGFTTTTDSDGNVQIYYYDFYVYIP